MPVKLATPLVDMLESEWRKQVLQLAHQLGWKSYFTFNSKGSSHGFPDLVLARDRVIYVELKREKTKTTGKQKEWLRALLAAHAEAYIARPRDLEALAAVLAHPGDPRLANGVSHAYGGWCALRASTLEECA